MLGLYQGVSFFIFPANMSFYANATAVGVGAAGNIKDYL